jgi:rubrerythrin
MGLTNSQEEKISSPVLSNERKKSSDQVINAFRRDISFSHRHHQRPTSKTDSNNLKKQIKNHNRSHSLDELSPKEDKNCSVIQHQWECQLCNTINQSDSELCSICGSSKINVYIPIMNPHDNNKSSDLSNQDR